MKPQLYILGLGFLLLMGCNDETIQRTDFGVHGIDVSHYQQNIDWDAVAGADIDFAFIKLSEGADFLDTMYCNNWAEAKRVGIIRGAYHFFQPNVDPLTQAFSFIKHAEMLEGDLPPTLDIELTGGLPSNLLVSKIKSWINVVELHYNVKPIIYTNQKFYNKHLVGSFEGYPLWIARYSDRYPVVRSQADWLFWQYGNKGTVPGIKGFVDLNVFKNTLKELDSLSYKPGYLTYVKKVQK